MKHVSVVSVVCPPQPRVVTMEKVFVFYDSNVHECKVKHPALIEVDGDMAIEFEYASRYGVVRNITLNLVAYDSTFIVKPDDRGLNLWREIHREQGVDAPLDALCACVNRVILWL